MKRRRSGGIRVKQIAYHRNGVSGRGFYAVTFTCPKNGEMVAGVFPQGEDEEGLPAFDEESPEVMVLNRDILPVAGVTFGRNSWRGDHYAAELFIAIRDDARGKE